MAPSANHQLAACTMQARHLIDRMGDAMHPITHLHLTVRVAWHNERCLPRGVYRARADDTDQSGYEIGDSSMRTDGCLNASQLLDKVFHTNPPENLVAVSNAVFEIVSTAVPQLQHLSLMGLCREVALQTFCEHCAELCSLGVEASSVPVSILSNLQVHLPKLARFTLMKSGVDGNDLQAFLEATITTLERCSSLIALVVDFGSKVRLHLTSETCRSLPPNLRKLEIKCPIDWLPHLEIILHPALHHFTVFKLPYNNLLVWLSHIPLVKVLRVLSDERVCLDGTKLYITHPTRVKPSAYALRQQLSTTGIQILCPNLMIHGCSEQLRDMLSWLRPFSSTVNLKVLISTTTAIHIFKRISSVFPLLEVLEIRATDRRDQYNCGSLPEKYLLPLSRCKGLKSLTLHTHTEFTTDGLIRLCHELPLLTALTCISCVGLDVDQVNQQHRQIQPSFQMETTFVRTATWRW